MILTFWHYRKPG
nr:unnamed protein product [Callosobruchus analis]